MKLKKKVLLIDVPLAELSKDEENAIRSILGEDGAVDVETGEKVSYQELFQVNEVERAIELTEEIFTDVFNLPETYKIEYDLTME